MSSPSPTPPVPEDGGGSHPLASPRSPRWTTQPVVPLPSGATMPRIGVGTWQLEGDEARRAVATALEIGMRHIDTAQMYGNEADVAAGIADAGVDRDDIFLTTKVANDRHEPGDLVDSVRESLDALDTDHVDLLLVHWPVEFDRAAATASAMAQVQASGMAHHIGLSNFTVEQLETVAGFAPFEVLQAERHPYLPQPALVDWCRSRGWAFTSYSPIAQGRVLDDPVIASIADELGLSTVQVTIAWQLADDCVAVIPRSTSAEHLRDNWHARVARLDPVALRRIDELRDGRRVVDPDFAPW